MDGVTQSVSRGSTKLVPLQVGLHARETFGFDPRRWDRTPSELSFDLGDRTGLLLGDCDARELLDWLGDPDELGAVSASLGEIDGSFAQPAAVILDFDGEGDRLPQSSSLEVGAGRTVRTVLDARPSTLRISLRVRGEGTFRRISILLRTESRGQAAVGDDTGSPHEAAKSIVLQVESASATRAAEAERAASRPWLDVVPSPLKEELQSLAFRSRARSLIRLGKRLQSDVEALRTSWPAGAVAPGSADSQKGVESAAEAALAAVTAARRALNVLEREIDKSVRPLGDPQATDLGDLQRVKPSDPARAEIAAEAAALIPANGLLAAVTTCSNSEHANDQAALMEMLGDHVSATDPGAATRSYWLSWARKQTPRRAATLASKMFKAGDISSAAALLEAVDPERETTVIRSLRVAAEIARGLDIPARGARAAPAVEDLAYVAAASQPFQATGYTVRTQELLTAMGRAGTSLTCYVRPGYPLPQLWQDAAEVPAERYRVGSVPYVLSRPGALEFTAGYYAAAAAALTRRFRERPPGIVQAASNHRNALPALIAARRLGIPFVYEVRGLWELTAASKTPTWDTTERFAQDRQLEMTVASCADHVLAITQGVAEELAAYGVNASRIALLPNGVDPEKFRPQPFDEELAASLGIARDDCVAVYAGSLVNYEGLDDAIAAVGILRERGLPARLIIVGDGAMRETLREQVLSSGLSHCVHLVGKVPPEDVARYISIAGMVPIARKPFKVCEVVSPLKPFEAMAMAKPVIVSNLPALREIVTDGRTGLICEAADPQSLAHAMARLHGSRELASRIGDEARDWIVNSRSWSAHAAKLREIFGELA